jgi:hypothetical protein
MVIWSYVDNKNFNILKLNGNGAVYVERIVNGIWQDFMSLWDVMSCANCDSIKQEGQKNTIAIWYKGNTFTIYVNGKYIFRDQDSAFTAGDICLGANSSETSSVEVSFDNLVVYSVDSWAPPDP